ncbi:hypothetical protein J6590_053112 [Homalodisca vitripennis]|nr:hypothetical protein J6590_053112 [Homalodisca vitripennis]
MCSYGTQNDTLEAIRQRSPARAYGIVNERVLLVARCLLNNRVTQLQTGRADARDEKMRWSRSPSHGALLVLDAAALTTTKDNCL